MRLLTSRNGWVSLLACLLWGLSACTSVPAPDLKMDTPQTWRNSPKASARQTDAKIAGEEWWLALNDPKLSAIVSSALAQNLTMAQVIERRKVVREMVSISSTEYFPRATFLAGPDALRSFVTGQSAGLSRSSQARFRSDYILGFDLIWEMPFFGKKESNQKRARAMLAKAEAEYHLIRDTLIAEVVRVYGELRAAKSRLAVLHSVTDVAKAIVGQAPQAHQAGLVSLPERDEMIGLARWVQVQAMQEELVMEGALAKLAVLCGEHSPRAEWSQTSSEWSLPRVKMPAQELPARFIEKRPDVYAAAADVLNAAASLGFARADLYPKLAIEGALLFRVGGGRHRSVSALAPAVFFPIIDWGASRKTVTIRELELQQTILAYRETALKAIAETETTFAHFNAADEFRETLEKDAQQPQYSYQQLQIVKEAGYLSNIDLLKSTLKLYEYQSHKINAQQDWLTAFLAVNKAVSSMGTSLPMQ